MTSVSIFVDHQIGYSLAEQILRDKFALRAAAIIVTADDAPSRWWPRVTPQQAPTGVAFHQYDPAAPDFEQVLPEVDYQLFLSWRHIMPACILKRARIGNLNLHYSLLPKYRGVYPVNQAIINSEAETGVTFHWVSGGIDSGPPLLQAPLAIHAADTAASLLARLDALALEKFSDVASLLAQGAAPPAHDSGANTREAQPYFSAKSFRETNELDLASQFTAKQLINLMRGKTFLPHGRNLYFRDPQTGEKVFVSIVLDPETEL